MKSEGVGTMSFVTPKGDSVKGFDRVIFCKNVRKAYVSWRDVRCWLYLFLMTKN